MAVETTHNTVVLLLRPIYPHTYPAKIPPAWHQNKKDPAEGYSVQCFPGQQIAKHWCWWTSSTPISSRQPYPPRCPLLCGSFCPHLESRDSYVLLPFVHFTSATQSYYRLVYILHILWLSSSSATGSWTSCQTGHRLQSSITSPPLPSPSAQAPPWLCAVPAFVYPAHRWLLSQIPRLTYCEVCRWPSSGRMNQ